MRRIGLGRILLVSIVVVFLGCITVASFRLCKDLAKQRIDSREVAEGAVLGEIQGCRSVAVHQSSLPAPAMITLLFPDRDLLADVQEFFYENGGEKLKGRKFSFSGSPNMPVVAVDNAKEVLRPYRGQIRGFLVSSPGSYVVEICSN